jgi:two-component system sensor histidine kinase QseC
MLVRDELYDHLDRDLEVRMRAVAEYAAAHPGEESVAEFMPQFRTRTHEDFFQIWDLRGRTLARSDSSIGRDLPRLEATTGRATYHDLALPDGHRGRAIAGIFPLSPQDTRGALHVVTAEETEDLERLEHRIHFLLLLVAAATIAAMLMIARHSVRRGLRPVDDFARAIETLDPEDPRARLDAGPLPSELDPVATRFAALLSRLLEALAREKRYARNVAHELRNPLAEMRLLADVGSRSQDAETWHDALRNIGAAAGELEQVVEALMALTRYEAGLETPEPEPIDLRGELLKLVQSMASAAEQHGLTVRPDIGSETWVYTDSVLLRRLLANLLGNAISHAPRGSVVAVSLGDGGIVTITNPAPHLRAADVPRLSERFFRIGDGNHGSHAGLGLSLATAIAKVLDLEFRLTLRDDHVLEATLSRFRTLSQSTEST